MGKRVVFQVEKKDKKSRGRLGVIKTTHGEVHTPAFVPVGTVGSVKSLTPQDVRDIGFEMILSNTYHLNLRPGVDILSKFGGLHEFMGWDGPMLTDSGGYQVFSLGVAMEQGIGKVIRKGEADSVVKPRLNSIREEGVEFQSHIDGQRLFLSPEKSIEIQEVIGADLIVGFDDLESPNYDHGRTLESLELTERWLMRSKKAHKRQDQLLYGVTHGGEFEDLRARSAQFNNKHFDAIALGGAHRDPDNILEVVQWTIPHLDSEKPRHLLGVGEVEDFFRMIPEGIDTFDCVVPTRLARTGWFFVHPPEGNSKNRFRKIISKAEFAESKEPLSQDCSCMVCKSFTRAYLHHLFRARELLSYRLITYHNLFFYSKLLSAIRSSMADDCFEELRSKWL